MNNKPENKKIGAVLIVGGGIGGMQAALDLAESGIKVYLAEKESAIGGVMAQLDKTFPTNDCAMCTMAPRIVEIGRHKDIEIITLSDVKKVEGEAGNFKVILYKKARYINLDQCTGCSLCVEKCPIQVDSEFDQGIIKRTAIYRRYPQAVPGAFAIDKQGISPCRFACPAGVNPHAYVALIAQGRFAEALSVQRRENPFPAICGRICPHGCETECRRSDLDQPIAIAGLKRFLADWELANPDEKSSLPQDLKTKKEKVAIIGSGPAGLSCAHYLAHKGYHITIFEAFSVAGGMLRVGIPAYRLPRDILEKEIAAAVTDLGVEIKLNTPVDSLDEIRAQGYNAVFVAAGAHKGLTLGVPGENSEGVVDAVAFLKDVNLGKEMKLAGKKVVVVGGGNTAFDAARSSLRLGASKVTVAYRRSRKEMPANPWEIEEAEQEGVKIQYLVAPVEILSKDGRVANVKYIKMQLSEPDGSGRRRPVPIKGSEFSEPADIVIPAISQQPDLSFLSETSDIDISRAGSIEVDRVTLETNIPGVFAGGDAVTGPATAIEAIQAGKIAAQSVDRYLRGEGLKSGSEKGEWIKAEKDIEGLPEKRRVAMPEISVKARRDNFKEIQLGYTAEQAIEEAKRCLDCATCCECLLCVEACGAKAINHGMDIEGLVTIDVGAIILCPGFEAFDPSVKPELGYGRYPNVITSLQFERILSASGPFSGKVLRPSDNKPPKRIAFLQCVGSRDYERDYCSSVCCMYATKEAIMAKEHVGKDLECDIFFMDVRAFGKGFEQYYERAKKEGVNYIRCRIPSIKEVPESRNLAIEYLTEDDKKVSREYDLAVLAVGLKPPKGVKEISEIFGIKLNKFDFCETPLFRPVESGREGIYVAGPFTEPKDIPETVMQASASASKVQSLLKEVRGSLTGPKQYPPEIDVTGQEPRIGVFVCHCGTNIAGVVNVPGVVEYAKSLPNVVFATNSMYTCSTDSCENIKKMIKEHSLNKVVVASCTPRTHEPLFRSVLQEAGLNPYLFEMANIRDQCSWVHMHEPERATRKAKDLVRMVTAKTGLLEPLYKGSMPLKRSALVLGGGLSGMVSALEIANQGFEVYLVEKESELGGITKRIRYLVNGENPQDEIKTLIKQVEEKKNIHLFTDAKIEKVEGSIGNFKTTILTKIGPSTASHEIEHGVVIVATGAKEYNPKEYLYGHDERVITQLELEERLSSNGKSKKQKQQPKTVVMIQCVGSRDEERPYCSRMCCTEAIKNALKIKENTPDVNVYILYKDIRTYGFREGYYTKAREKGVVFIRYEDNKNPEVSINSNHLNVKVFDQILGMPMVIPADLVVLSAGIVAEDHNKIVAQFLKVPLTQDNFFLEAHMKLRPVDFANDGVFLCGLAHSSKSIEESIIQAQAAAGRAGTILSKDRIELEANISSVIDENCDGCAYCVDPCPFKAITLIEFMKEGSIKKTVQVNESLCKGCGTCMATCPKTGIIVKGFKLGQIAVQVEAALQPIE